MTQPADLTSTRPYLIRAWHEWCSDNGLTPYVTVAVNDAVQVPREFVKDGEIVLNIGYEATTALAIGNDYLAFKARFSGVAKDIMIPIEQVLAIFARENGQGMAFVNTPPAAAVPAESDPSRLQRPTRLASVAPVEGADAAAHEAATAPVKPGRPSLTRIK